MKKKLGIIFTILLLNLPVFSQLNKKWKVDVGLLLTGFNISSGITGFNIITINPQIKLKHNLYLGYKLSVELNTLDFSDKSLYFTETINNQTNVYEAKFYDRGCSSFCILESERPASYNIPFNIVNNEVNINYYFLKDSNKTYAYNIEKIYEPYIGLGGGLAAMSLDKPNIVFSNTTRTDFNYINTYAFFPLYYINPKIGIELLFEKFSTKVELGYFYYFNNLKYESTYRVLQKYDNEYGRQDVWVEFPFKVELNASYFERFQFNFLFSF